MKLRPETFDSYHEMHFGVWAACMQFSLVYLTPVADVLGDDHDRTCLTLFRDVKTSSITAGEFDHLEGCKYSYEHKPSQNRFCYEAEYDVDSFTVEIVFPSSNALVLQNHVYGEDVE